MKRADVFRLVILLAVLAAAVYYPVEKILSFEYPEVPPREFRFRTGAVDPYDPFRGRYVTLNPLPNSVKAGNAAENGSRKYRYAVLTEGKDGFAEVVRLAESPPEGEPFVRIDYSYMTHEWQGNKKSEEAYHRFSFPFNRFYLNEELAPEAEKLVADIIRKNADGCVLSVLVYADGSYAVKDLLIEGKPIRDVLRQGKNGTAPVLEKSVQGITL